MKIIVGGTFDKLHRGHKVLLDQAIKLAKLYNAEMIVTISGDIIAMAKSHPVRKYSARAYDVEGYLIVWGGHVKYKIWRLDSSLLKNQLNQPELYKEFMNDEKKIIVVSEETYSGALDLNQSLKDLKLQPLTIVVVPMVMGEDGERISSTRVREKKITLTGEVI